MSSPRRILAIAIFSMLALFSLLGQTKLKADGFIDFESGTEGQPISSTIDGLQFTTTAGYDWIYGDWRTGKYNGPFPNGAYISNGNFFAWLGPNQGMGRIDFTQGCATYLQVWVSSYSTVTADAHYSDGSMAATASAAGNLNTGQMSRLRVDAPAGRCFNYVLIHDTGNYWLIDDLSTDAGGVPQQRPPVILLPGLMGSALSNNDACKGEDYEVWPNPGEYLTSLQDQDLEHLRLATNGVDPASSCDRISPAGVITSITAFGYPIQQIYGPLIEYLEDYGYDVYAFDYDWRLDLRDTADQLDAFVDQVLSVTGAGKVAMVDHSLGGLLARHYVTSSSTRATKVEQVISLGTPFLGAPGSFRALRVGDPLPILKLYPLLNEDRVRELLQNAPVAYQLQPSQSYWDVYGDVNGGKYYRRNGVLQTRDQTRNVVLSQHNRELALDGEAFHSASMDDWTAAPSSVPFRLIVGSGREDTVGVYSERVLMSWGGSTLIWWDLEPTDGDSTVPLRSANLRGNGHDHSGGTPIWYTNGVDHGELTRKEYVLEFVAVLLATPPTTNSPAEQTRRYPVSAPALYEGSMAAFVAPTHHVDAPPTPPEMSTQPFPLDGGQVAAFGADAMHVYDAAGNHTGPLPDDSIEYGIPGSGYDILSNSVFVTVPAGATYRIVVEPSADGLQDIRVRNLQGIDGDPVQRTVTYLGLNVPEEGTATLTYDPHNTGAASSVNVDLDGNGATDRVQPPSGDLGPGAPPDSTAPSINIRIAGSIGPQGWYVGPVQVTVEVADSGSGVSEVTYSVDRGRTVLAYTAPVTVQAEHVRMFVAQAVDRAGNRNSASALIGPAKSMMPMGVK